MSNVHNVGLVLVMVLLTHNLSLCMHSAAVFVLCLSQASYYPLLQYHVLQCVCVYKYIDYVKTLRIYFSCLINFTVPIL